jgi:hypothetical protein
VRNLHVQWFGRKTLRIMKDLVRKENLELFLQSWKYQTTVAITEEIATQLVPTCQVEKWC